jgi:hypothetical protein
VLLQDAASRRINILNAMCFTAEACHSAQAFIMKNYFINGGFLSDDIGLDAPTDDTSLDETEVEDWQLLQPAVKFRLCDM